jgi:hypothetical protein
MINLTAQPPESVKNDLDTVVAILLVAASQKLNTRAQTLRQRPVAHLLLNL